jgi:hypothetical protein
MGQAQLARRSAAPAPRSETVLKWESHVVDPKFALADDAVIVRKSQNCVLQVFRGVSAAHSTARCSPHRLSSRAWADAPAPQTTLSSSRSTSV